MMKQNFATRFAVSAVIAALWMVPVAAFGQTRIVIPKNKYKVDEDVKLGRQAAAEVERKFPIINDRDANDYIERVGQRLVAAIPNQFDQPAFEYRFKWVNASDLNAFALPGGPMYVNRGMIMSARTEGEMAGVMAHEISHVALRHATAQATKQSSAKNTLGTIGLILGGAILGGQAGAQLGMLGAQAWMTKYSREYESQADIMGAQIMAAAGYDPRDLANVFRTIESQRQGGGAPEWLSSHPNPGNRYEAINREAARLRISPNTVGSNRDFERIRERFRSLSPARSMSEIERNSPSGGGQSPTEGGRYSSSVPSPSTRMRSYTGLNWLRMTVPTNWRDFGSQDDVQFAPEGAYGSQGLTHGMMIGVYRSNNGGDLYNDTETYVQQLLQGNSYLQQRGSSIQTTVGGRSGLSTTLFGRSPITNRNELVTVYTAKLRSGELFYAIGVVPEAESYNYNRTFRTVLQSISFNG